MKTRGINPALFDMIARGQLSSFKIQSLIRLNEFIDGYARTDFVGEDELKALVQRFGTEPDIRTWGDYFQTEIASRFFLAADGEFEKVIETIRYDVIAAMLIFQDKPISFLDEVADSGQIVSSIPEEQWNDEQKECAHLAILLTYYKDMRLDHASLKQQDLDWFHDFVPEARSGAV